MNPGGFAARSLADGVGAETGQSFHSPLVRIVTGKVRPPMIE
jgi:hypothetical protein